MATTISVPYTILMDSGIIEASPKEGPYAVVRFKCLTSDRYQMVADLLGRSLHSGGTITRVYPFQYPPSPNLICRAIESIEMKGPAFPLPGGAVWIGRKYSYVTARFEIPLFTNDGSGDASGQPYTSTTFDGAGEILTLPGGVYKFSGSVPTQTPIGLTIPQITITLKRFMLPFPPVAQIAALIGKVNNATVTIGGYAFAAGYLLFAAGPVTIQADTQGNLLYEAEYKMVYRPYPWNFALHPNGTTGFAAITDGSGNGPYATGDFTILP